MPESAMKGLKNALNKSGVKVETQKITGNMTQVYRSSSLNLVPFRSANMYVQSEKKWYGIVINADSMTISDEALSYPEYLLYPSDKQTTELLKIAGKVNKGGLGWGDKVALMKLWLDMKKEVR
jgi:hypothetical protein